MMATVTSAAERHQVLGVTVRSVPVQMMDMKGRPSLFEPAGSACVSVALPDSPCDVRPVGRVTAMVAPTPTPVTLAARSVPEQASPPSVLISVPLGVAPASAGACRRLAVREIDDRFAPLTPRVRFPRIAGLHSQASQVMLHREVGNAEPPGQRGHASPCAIGVGRLVDPGDLPPLSFRQLPVPVATRHEQSLRRASDSPGGDANAC